MLHVNVRHFMRHHARKLRFILSCVNGSNIDEHRAARKSERIDFLLLHHVKFVRPRILLRNLVHEFPAESLNVLCLGARIRQHRHLLVNLRCGLQPKLLLVLS